MRFHRWIDRQTLQRDTIYAVARCDLWRYPMC